jgi:DNA-directed RNA polymerase III subunit RPC3
VLSISDRSFVRAAIVVLMQHGIVSAVSPQSVLADRRTYSARKRRASRPAPRPPVECAYRFQRDAAYRLLRYAKWIEFCRRTVMTGDDVAAAALQCLLTAGRLTTGDWISRTVEARLQAGAPVDPRYTAREQAVEAAHQLQAQGLVVEVPPAFGGDEVDETDESGEEHEFEEEPPPEKSITKKRRRSDSASNRTDLNGSANPLRTATDETEAGSRGIGDVGGVDDGDPVILAILGGSAHYRNSLLPATRVWRVNSEMFYAYHRAYQLGRLVADRYGHKVQSCGSLVTAALKLAAQSQHNPHDDEERQRNSSNPSSAMPSFTPRDLIKHAPKSVLQTLDKMPGGLHHNLSKAFRDLVEVAESPAVVRVVVAVPATSTPSEAESVRYRIRVDALTRYLQERIVHQIVTDRHGLVAARVVSLLSRLGFLEAETVADHAMVPVREAREVLHGLYRSRYVDVLTITAGGGGGAGSGGAISASARALSAAPSAGSSSSYSGTVYLWGVRKARLRRQVLDDVAKALVNIRLRRQHELEIGKEWIQRDEQADDTDENDHEADRTNYAKFRLGLERLDVAALQLDDTLLALSDFR